MTQTAYLASAVTMGAVLFVVAALFGRHNTKHRATGDRTDVRPRWNGTQGSARSSALPRIARDPTTWYVGFALAALAAAAAGVLFVAGDDVIVGVGESAGLAAGVVLALLLVLYLFLGTYTTARNRGRPEAQAVAEGLAALGGLLILAVVVALVSVPFP